MIIVIGILAAVTILGYGAWRKNVAEAQVKSDLNGLIAAMDNARTFGEGYPVYAAGTEFDGTNSTQSVFVQSDGVTLTYYSGSATSYCVDARSDSQKSVYFFLDTDLDAKNPKVGTCAGGEGAVPSPFDQTWTVLTYDTTRPGCATTVYLPVTSPTSGGTIDWGDGTTGALSGSLTSHTYSSEGQYVVGYSGPITTFNTSGITATAQGCLKSLDQWASTATPTTVRFANSSQLTSAAQPPVSVTVYAHLFANATSFNQSIGAWDVSNITDFTGMFAGAASFNQPLNAWNTSSMRSTASMFANTASFNQPLDNWNTSQVLDMRRMFASATAFNGAINTWDVSGVTNFYEMFNGASAFNQPLSNWDLGSALTLEGMFRNATAFNQDISNFFNGQVYDLSYMFYGASSFNQNLGPGYANVDNVSPSPPPGFDTGATAWTLPKPVWP